MGSCPNKGENTICHPCLHDIIFRQRALRTVKAVGAVEDSICGNIEFGAGQTGIHHIDLERAVIGISGKGELALFGADALMDDPRHQVEGSARK